uniref:Uncharacterized protein n=1 Tax=Oryza glumipatula TaxID=40148 RepID=A0A0E0AG80_9ORYZ
MNFLITTLPILHLLSLNWEASIPSTHLLPYDSNPYSTSKQQSHHPSQVSGHSFSLFLHSSLGAGEMPMQMKFILSSLSMPLLMKLLMLSSSLGLVFGMLPTLRSVFAWPSSSPSPAEGAPIHAPSRAIFLLCTMSPLLVIAVTAPTLGVVMIRNS